jgi:topoisomerase-4 subunit A
MSDMAERLALHEFTENAYLNYSMYVIMDRALPFIGDGLKPFSAASSMRCPNWG